MELSLALRGDLKRMMELEERAGRRAVTRGVRAAADGLKQDLREATSGRLGRKMGNTWRSKIYPSGGESLGAAGIVYTKAEQVLLAFEQGAVIRSKDGLFLAIPTPAAPKRGAGGKRITPSNFPEYSYGRLRYVYRPGQTSLLVVDNARVTKAGRVVVNTRRRKDGSSYSALNGRAVVVMFILVPQVKLPKVFDVDQTSQAWHARLPDLILKEWVNGTGA